jgi:hypothetical protein
MEILRVRRVAERFLLPWFAAPALVDRDPLEMGGCVARPQLTLELSALK